MRGKSKVVPWFVMWVEASGWLCRGLRLVVGLWWLVLVEAMG